MVVWNAEDSDIGCRNGDMMLAVYLVDVVFMVGVFVYLTSVCSCEIVVEVVLVMLVVVVVVVVGGFIHRSIIMQLQYTQLAVII